MTPPDRQATSHNVSRFLEQRAREDGHNLALRAPVGTEHDGTIRYTEATFGQLHRQAVAASLELRRRSIGDGTRTLLLVRPGQQLIELCFALFYVGAVPVVIDPGMGLRAFLRCVRRTRPTAIVGIPAATWLSRLPLKAFAPVGARLTVRRKWAPPTPASGAIAPIARGADDLAAILFTSGSTGAPKGVRYTHGMFAAQVELLRETFGIRPGEVDLPMLPIFALFNPALGMATIVPQIDPRRPATADPAQIVQAIRQNHVTSSFGSPVLWWKVAAHARARGLDFPSLRRVLIAGAPVPARLVRDLKPLLPHGEVHVPYGATECLPVSQIAGTEILAETAPASITGAGTCVGRPVSGVEVRVIEIVNGPLATLEATRELPPGEIGELVVTGPSVTRAYDALPEATARAKIHDAAGGVWHRMGDAGYRDARGRVWFCGRIAERVHTPTAVLYPEQIEPLFAAALDGLRCALIGRGVPPDQRPGLVVEVPRGQKRPSLALLRQIATSHALSQGIDSFFFVRRLPVDVRHNAKVHRLALAARFGHRSTATP